ncbi:MAG: hypothetical protein JW720_09810 [Sedimentisphaerales bacterium]|nr:hypothetical protein [Sedimentisphaerales bacterium]
MSILSVNLKHLYQRRGMWLIYALLSLPVFHIVIAPLRNHEPGKGWYVGPVMFAFVIGLLTTLPQTDVLSKPFSYCLPGHRRVIRKYIFSTALATGLVCSMFFLTYHNLFGRQMPLVLCSAFFAALTFYLAGVVPALIGMKTGVALFILLPVTVVAGEHYELDIFLERLIVEQIYPTILTGIISGIAMWLWLSRKALARRYCSGSWTGFLDVFNAEKLRRSANAALAARPNKHPKPWVEKWFLSRMNKYDYSGPGRYIWGTLYSTSAPAVSQWPNLLLLALVVAIMFGYAGGEAGFVFVLLPAMVVLNRHLAPINSTMLIPPGRRRRFTTALGLAVTDAVMLCIFTLIVSGLSSLLARLVPTFTISGITFTLRAIDPRLALAPLIFLPVTSAVQLYFHKTSMVLMSGVLILLFYLVVIAVIIRQDYLNVLLSSVVVSLPAVILLTVSWAIFLLVLRHVCSKQCLIK